MFGDFCNKSLSLPLFCIFSKEKTVEWGTKIIVRLRLAFHRFESHIWLLVFPVTRLRAICDSQIAFKIEDKILQNV